jgi:adenosylhomocysteine nucleosidase
MDNVVVVALEQEAPDLVGHPNVFFCGVGKINAAMTAARLIERYEPRCVINLGTAGGITVGTGLHQATRFVQRDMQCTGLGFQIGETPYDGCGVMLEINSTGLICSTGDNFVTDPDLEITADLVDMESYAIAKTCVAAGVEFLCYKFVTDQANPDAYRDWHHMISAGQLHYINILESLGIMSRSTS